MKNKTFLIIFLALLTFFAFGQDPEEQIFDLSLEELMNMDVISATKKAQSIEDAPAIITVITSAQIKERGYQTVAEAMEDVVGINVSYDHFQSDVGVRGINGGMRSYSRIVKVMIDGQAVSFRSSSDNYLDASLIPINAVERIEIIRGPNSALYGADAYLGVINIITSSGDKLENSVMAKIGSIQGNLSSGGSAVLASKKGNFEYLVSGSFEKTDRSGQIPVDLPEKTTYADLQEKSENAVSRPMNLFGKFTFSKESFGKLGVDFNFQHIDTYSEFQDWGILTHDNRISLYNTYIRGNYSRSFSDKLEANISIVYAKGEPTTKEHLSIGTDDWLSREMSYVGADAKAELVYNINQKNSFTVGVDYTNDKHEHQTFYLHTADTVIVNNDWVKDNYDVPDLFSNTGVYLQNILNLGFVEKLSITSGIRYDNHSVYGDATNYRAGLVYKFTDKIYSKLLYGTSFKAPSSIQLYTNFLKIGGVIGNPDLEPEKASIIDFQLAGQIGDNMMVSVDAYKNNTENKVELGVPQGSATDNIRALNLATIKSMGIEGEAIMSISKIKLHANYSFQQSTITTTKTIEPDKEYEMDINLYPQHMIKYGINAKIPKAFLSMNLQGRYIGSRIASSFNTRQADNITYITDYEEYLKNRYQLDAYMLIDLVISTYNLNISGENEIQILCKIYNILDQEHAYPGFRFDYDIPGHTRSLILSIIYHF